MSAPNARHHVAPSSNTRRNEALVLGAISVVAVACASGPQWVQYLGLALVIAALAGSTWRSWREIDRLSAEHAAAIKAMRAQAKAVGHAHHEEQMAMIARFSARSQAQREQLLVITAELEQVTAELEAARAEGVELATELDESRTTVSELEERLADLTKQLEELAAQTPDADVLPLPRRVEDDEPVQELRQA